MTARVFDWDWKEQPDIAAIAAAVTEMSASGQVFMREIETGGDNYAWVLSDTELTAGQAWRLYLGEDGYAANVVAILRDHFPGLADETTAEVVTDLIEQRARYPQAPFEVIVDDPVHAKWRLRGDSADPSCVRLACYRRRRSEADAELERTVNDALRALEGPR